MFTCKESQRSRFQSRCHTLEVWTLAFLPRIFDKPILFSGGDDSMICANWFDLRHQGPWGPPGLPGRIDRDLLPPDRKIHSAGVTAILPLVATADPGEQIVVTGSYDEYIRVLSAPKSSFGSNWRPLAEKRLGGGVWRLKLIKSHFWQGSNTFTILASCMHAGARIIDIQRSTDSGWKVRTRAKFNEHESMNYASDARQEPSHSGRHMFTVVSTSFYDKKLCLWKYEIA